MIKITPNPKPYLVIEDIKNAIDEVSIEGMVYNVRDMGNFYFILLRTSRDIIQFVWDMQKLGNPHVNEGDCVVLSGMVKIDKRAKLGFEIHATKIEFATKVNIQFPITINKNRINLNMDNHLHFRPIVLRNERQRAIFKLQEGLSRGFREFLTSQKFTEIHSPKITAAGAEGGANIFKLDYFEKEAFLAQSPQFYKQAMIPVFGRVFEIGPVFRAEKHDTSRHTNEYTSLDFEMSFIKDHTDIMKMEAAALEYMFNLLIKEYAQELELLKVTLPEISSIPAVKFVEAKDIIAKEFNRPIKNYTDLEPEEERLLGKWADKNFGTPLIFITHYPTKARPFYTMDDPDDPEYTLGFDLILNGIEITTGGQRINDYQMQIDKMKRFDMEIDKFESYLMTHKYGTPPHGGLGLGLERLTMQLIGLDNIRYATLFPRDMNHITP